MRFQLTAIGLACATLLAACGGGGAATGAKNQSVDFAFPGAHYLLTPPSPLVATASSGLPITFTSDTPSICTVNGVNLVAVKAGECSVTASQAGDSTYLPNSSKQLFNILKHTQSVTFPSPGFQSITVTPAPLVATAETGLPVSFSSDTPSICTVSGTTLTLVSKGTCTLTATQAGNDTYAAGSAKALFVVGDDKPPVITLLSGVAAIDRTTDGDYINRWAGSNLDNYGCNDPNWCGTTFNAADSSFTFKYVIQTNDPKHPWNGGFIDRYFGFDVAAHGVQKNNSGDTTDGPRVSKQLTLKITLAQNDEWVQTGRNELYLIFVLGHYNNGCNVAPHLLFKPVKGALRTYEVPLSDVIGFDADCGLKGLDAAAELLKYPIIDLKVYAPNANTSVAGASPTTPGYPTALTIQGPITIQ
ncbi:MAG: hypothetical protein ABIT83_18330 [Massilia sp.]